METIVHQYCHRPNITELGLGNTHETYMLINADVDLSSIFPSGIEVDVEDTKTKKKYSLKSAKGREFRVNQMGAIYRDYDVVPGDEIFITCKEKNGENKIYVTVKKYHRVVLIVSNNGVEINNEERLDVYKIDANRNYCIDINEGAQIFPLSIKFKESKKKRADSPNETDFFEVKKDNVILDNGTYYLTLDGDISLCKLDKYEYSTTKGENNTIAMTEYEKNISAILLASHNIILHGAPGTGKTYLAKRIAKAMNAQFKMVQFHPSYDYTDFVEGLRPYDDGKGNVVFKRKDGTFKEFCKNALNADDASHGNLTINSSDLQTAWNALIKDVKNGTVTTLPLKGGKLTGKLSVDEKDTIRWGVKEDGRDEIVKSQGCGWPQIEGISKINNGQLPEQVGEIGTAEHCSGSQTSNLWAIYANLINRITTNRQQDIKESRCSSLKTPYIFLIDEINRGDMSKIFGELFFAIDPGYRGCKEDKIETQYQNLVEDSDEFKSGFYVPENIYIIGTMNDIDRSVESMDFAMRRRFQFIEVTAEDRAEGMGLKTKKQGEEGYDKTEAYNRMTNLNNCIISKEIGLSKAYQIGGAYFLTKNNKNETIPTEDFENLWKYRLEGLLREYLRGEEENTIVAKMEKLERAFNFGNLFSEGTKENQDQPNEDILFSESK